jgi:hypothetical protein
LRDAISKKNSSQKRAGEWLKVGPEFKPQYHKINNKDLLNKLPSELYIK